jgi:DNA-binding transcriptional LysR family regulator
VDTHLLRTFVTVARRGSFSAAADELGYTQSAVSQHIASLEADLRTPLLHRRPVGVTEAGARLLEHAEPLLLRLAAARADVRRLVTAPPEHLVVGASALALTGGFASRLADLRSQRPEVSVTVRTLSRPEIPARVADGTLDVGLVDGVAAPTDPLPLPDVGPLHAVALAEEPLVVVLPPDHPLADRQALDLPHLADARWIDAPEAAMPLDRLRTASGTDGFRPSLRYEGPDVRGLINLATAGHGLALLPRSAANGVPLLRLLHRVELLHGGPAAGLLTG